MYRKSKQSEPKVMSTAAIDYEAREVAKTKRRLEKWVRKETRGFGDTTEALRRISRDSGIPFWTLYRIWQGKAKTVTSGLREWVADSYVAYCERQLNKAIEELRIEKAMNPHADYSDLDDQVSDLVAKMAAYRANKGA